MDLSVIILNWNAKDDLRNCLKALTEQAFAHEVEIIVVDNASNDGSWEMLQAEFSQFKFIQNPRNVGFGAGNNCALPHATGRHILFLNSDTIVTPGAFDKMIVFADANPDIGILGPKLLNADGSLQYSCRRYPTLGAGFFRNTPLGRLFPKNRFAADYLLRDWDHAGVRDVDWVSGAALMIRRETLEQVGAFDEAYYFYCEDVDLCWRVNHANRPDVTTTARRANAAPEAAPLPLTSETFSGRPSTDSVTLLAENVNASPRRKTWRVTYFPDAVIYHIIGRSTDKVPTRMTYEFHKSMYIFYKKHYAKDMFFALRPLILPGIVARAIGQLARYWWRSRRVLRERRREREKGRGNG